MENFKNNFPPTSFDNTWVANRINNNDQAEIVLPNDEILYVQYVPNARTKITAKMPITFFPKTWCEFPWGEIKFICNKLKFNSTLIKIFYATETYITHSLVLGRFLNPWHRAYLLEQSL